MTAFSQSPNLTRVAKGDLCAGCGACAGLFPDRILMQASAPGWLRPKQSGTLAATEEARIARICPGLGQEVEPGERLDSVLWGPYVSAQTGWATDPEVRFAGSSGGVLTILLMHLLKSGRVEAVVQTAAAPDLPIGNTTVISTDAPAVLAAAGSRYAPSAPLSDVKARMADGRRYAFVGKPCDAAAMRALVEDDPKAAAAFPVILSFFCAGVPSHAGGKAVLQALGTDLDHVESFRFRGNGWPGRATAVLKDGGERSMSYHDSWGKILSRHVQNRCKVCADGAGVASDIVCADAWESDDAGYPVFEEGEGTSLILARTALGSEILAEAIATGRVETQPFDMGTLAAIQPGQRERRRALLARLTGLALAGRPIPRYRGLQVVAAARQNSLKSNLNNLIGMFRRALRRTKPQA